MYPTAAGMAWHGLARAWHVPGMLRAWPGMAGMAGMAGTAGMALRGAPPPLESARWVRIKTRMAWACPGPPPPSACYHYACATWHTYMQAN